MAEAPDTQSAEGLGAQGTQFVEAAYPAAARIPSVVQAYLSFVFGAAESWTAEAEVAEWSGGKQYWFGHRYLRPMVHRRQY